MSKLDHVSGALCEITYIGIMLFLDQNSVFQRTIFRYLWITLISRDKRRRTLMYCKRLPSLIIGTLMETSHCLNPGWVWQESNYSTNIHQTDTCRFEADKRRNRLLQDPNSVCQESGQECRKTLSKEPEVNRQKKNPNWTQRENDEEVTLLPKMIRMMRRSWTTRGANAKSEEAQRCLLKSARQSTRTVHAGGPCASDWSKLQTKRLTSSCSKQYHENITIEAQRIRTTE